MKPVETRELRASIEMALHRHRMEERVRDSEERYHELFDNANDAIFIVGLDGVIKDLNRAAEQLLGCARAEAVAQPYQRFLTPKSRARVEEHIRHLQLNPFYSPMYEVEMIRTDGNITPVEVRARFIRDHTGAPVGMQSIARDITERKALERQRSEFLAMLTHDIKNPLGVVLGYAEMLLDSAAARGAAEDAAMLQRLQAQALLVHSLVANYLELSRVEAGHLSLNKQPLLLNELLQQTQARHQGEAQMQHITLTLHVPEKSPIIEGDLNALSRVFSNLLHNALKFTPRLGQIALSVEHGDGEAIVSVADSGPGIAPDELRTIFDKYARGAASRRRRARAFHREDVSGSAWRARPGREPERERRVVHRVLTDGSAGGAVE